MYLLTSVTIPDSVTSIGESAFEGCTSLESIIIPENVTSIGSWSFYRCASLKTITIPVSVTTIERNAFEDCTSLENIVFEGTIDEWNTIWLQANWKRNVPVTEVICSNGTVSLK